jgi:hypothetical protein
VSSVLNATSGLIESSGTFAADGKARHLAASDSTSNVSALSRLSESAKAVRVPMTPAAFKTAAYVKGWTLRALADRWGITPAWMTRLAGNVNRAANFDDAVRGLPRVGPPLPLPRAWHVNETDAKRPLGPGFRYHGYLVIGAMVAASKDIGSMAEEGMHGIVVHLSFDRSQEVYRVVFETGEIEGFTPDLVDEYLVGVGLERNELKQYRYVDDQGVRQDFARGRFVF